MDKKKKLVYGVIAVLVLVIVWAVLTVPKPPTKEEADKAAKKFMEFENHNIHEDKNGKRIWEITTKKTIMNAKTNDAEFFDVVGKFNTEDGKVITVKAPHGSFVEKTKDVILDKNVIATTSDGAVLTSEKLDWNGKKEMLTATGKAKLKKDEFEAEGDKIEAYDNFEEFRATGHAHIIKRKAK